MPRIARGVAVDFPHHIIQRGNNRERVFFHKRDKDKYLSLLIKYSERWHSPILVYCLMDNHVHLLAKPLEDVSLSKMMQGVTLCYTQYVNRRYKRTGRLWESRYHSCIVDKDRYLWAAARYIEQNPLRANMVSRAEDFPYSSARAHINGIRDDVLGEELFPEKQRRDYSEFVSFISSEDEMKEIRYFTRTGRPLGSEQFVSKMEQKLQRKFTLKSPGRPRKKKE
ncbi:transposase IS200 like protein [bacterium BMS3Abin07]|nr:transposase IS200 like protein [bacterium BMS3Abin07]GBE32737.1 transposase IS200 like protein [bacterium BMS3Bbin05]HDL21039.1 transposase [Nitrospirota bacterium]HDO23464.1 transposase [Nitrospirota bacterium]HDZ88026.1 transposase [Nitrospirota bacterium]